MSNLTMQSLKIAQPIFIVKIFCIFSKTRLVALYLHQAELSYVLLRVAFTKDHCGSSAFLQFYASSPAMLLDINIKY